MHRKNGSDKVFYFKHFHVYHDRCAMKVGTDGVLLGAWCNVDGRKKILDIGTGTGLIALMLAQRSTDDCLIDAIEIDEEASIQARENVLSSPWKKKINVIQLPVQQFEPPITYDLIACNPPYFVDSLKPPNKKRIQARHATDLPYPALIASVKLLLSPTGLFCLILPNEEGSRFMVMAAKSGLFCTKKLAVRSKGSKPIERLLLEFSLISKNRTEGELLISDEKGNWTNEYCQMVASFYLKL